MSSTDESSAVEASVESARPRGRLKIYLGYASHTGKTWRLLEEARRRQARGQDVVIGWLREKDRPALAHLLGSLEQVPARETDGCLEMDSQAILERHPQVCIIDELAHANVPGSRRAHRWQDVEDFLAAGISVVTALNIQYIEGQRKKVEELTGKEVTDTVPDALVREADEVAVVDASPEEVLTHPDPSNPTAPEILALRRLALLFAADAVEEDVQEFKQSKHIDAVWETQERLLVCLTADERSHTLLDRAKEVKERWDGKLYAVYVAKDPGRSNITRKESAQVDAFIELARAWGATIEENVCDPDPARGILAVARKLAITQIFLGHTRVSRFVGKLSRTVAGRIIHEADGMDVHVVAEDRRQEDRAEDRSKRFPETLARLLSETVKRESRGHERIYLGYAPGVGKSYQMLLDGQYLRDHGQDVVVGLCDAHDREDVLELEGLLERVPPLETQFGKQMDVEAVLRRRPQVCLVDDLAARVDENTRRYEQVQSLLDAGIHVFTTLDVSEIESLRDAVARITCACVVETVPDWRLDEADELVFVDAATRALLNRVKRGCVFGSCAPPPDMETTFEEGRLNALRELAMRVTAERVGEDREALDKSREPHSGKGKAILACVHQRPSAAAVLRRARRTADRLDVPCFAVYVAPDEDWTGLSDDDRKIVEDNLALSRSLRIETYVLYGQNVDRTLGDFATRHHVGQIFFGRSRKTGWQEFFQRSVIEGVMHWVPWCDVQVIAER